VEEEEQAVEAEVAAEDVVVAAVLRRALQRAPCRA